MNRHYSFAPAFIFPLMVLSILTALSFWLAEATEVTLVTEQKKLRDDPDILADNLTLFRYDADGFLKYKLSAPRLFHYPHNDSSLIETPRLTSYDPDAPEIVMTSDTATITEKGRRIEAKGNVSIKRAAFGKYDNLLAQAPELTVLPEQGLAFNQHPTRIENGKSWIKGTGFRMDHNKRIFSLESKVTAQYVKPPASRPPRNMP